MTFVGSLTCKMSASMRRISENRIKPLTLSYEHICFTSGSLRWEHICAAVRHFCSSLSPWDPSAFISPSPLLGSLPPASDPAFWKVPFPQLCFLLYCRQSLKYKALKVSGKQDQVCFYNWIELKRNRTLTNQHKQDIKMYWILGYKWLLFKLLTVNIKIL